jgi:hypothetical protein
LLTVEQLERAAPWVKWGEPIRVSMADGDGWACRVCIAQLGLTGEQSWRLFSDRRAFRAHFKETHQ